MRRCRFCASLAIVAIGLAGCGSSGTSSGGATTTTPASPKTSIDTTPSSTASGTTPGTTTSGAGSRASSSTSPATTSTRTRAGGTTECATSDLAASVGSGNGAAGTAYYQLKLRNTSSTTCYERGYAGVSLLDSSGRQIGAAAVRETAGQPKVVLPPGQTAYATLGVAEAGNFPSSCGMTQSAELRVYPPNQTAKLTIPFRAQGCTNGADKLLHINPFTSSPPR
ncbi:MAG: DUF4232 domain-containing protein [Solirubrobacteraceae bacterium]